MKNMKICEKYTFSERKKTLSQNTADEGNVQGKIYPGKNPAIPGSNNPGSKNYRWQIPGAPQTFGSSSESETMRILWGSSEIVQSGVHCK